MPDFTKGDVTIHYEERGSGFPLLLIPGGFSPLHARMAEALGYQAFFMAGSQIAAYLYGYPDVGLIGLGEMVTATQSIDDDTLRLLGGELNYDVQVVSPEDEDRELLEQYDLEFGEDEGDEADLEIRGPGEFLGTRQAGALPFRIADLVRDKDWLLRAREDVVELLKLDPRLENPENSAFRAYIDREGHLQGERLKTS